MTNQSGRKPLDIEELHRVAGDRGSWVGFPMLYPAAPTPLLEQAMRFIEEHPERHEQSEWMTRLGDFTPAADDGPICGTAGCLAGWGIALNDPLEGQQIVPDTGLVVLADQRRYATIAEYAAYLFGITPSQARVLFEGIWQTTNLRGGVDAIKANPAIDEYQLRRAMH